MHITVISMYTKQYTSSRITCEFAVLGFMNGLHFDFMLIFKTQNFKTTFVIRYLFYIKRTVSFTCPETNNNDISY